MNNDWMEPVGLIAAIGYVVWVIWAAAALSLLREKIGRAGMWRLRLFVLALVWPISGVIILLLWIFRLLAAGFSDWRARLNDAWEIFETTLDARPQLILRDVRRVGDEHEEVKAWIESLKRRIEERGRRPRKRFRLPPRLDS